MSENLFAMIDDINELLESNGHHHGGMFEEIKETINSLTAERDAAYKKGYIDGQQALKVSIIKALATPQEVSDD